ncbi:porin [Sphingomonas sp. LY54]|uniref:porin n=1 Tax=Sphingomonas sp. LY54 TaxID=3095343 RepID=UPI002D78DD86|nr:porin [Sphingomonas sp. LY54]WRP30220.1 porin [Sphingomonas sp. LY54]
MKLAGIGAVGGTALVALSLLLTPAIAASNQPQKAKKAAPSLSLGSGNGFTPAIADPRLAAEFARRGLQSSFRFTPSSASGDKSKAVRVAVRARSGAAALAARGGENSASAVTAITPTAYNLGVSVGWKRFALSGDVAKVDGGPVPGGREAAEVGVSYSLKKFTGRLAVGAERSDGTAPLVLPKESSYSVDVGGSYRLTRNLDLTGGVRYRIQHDRLEALEDDRRDSQAVYIGTAFRF